MRRRIVQLAGICALAIGYVAAVWAQGTGQAAVPRLIRFSGTLLQAGEKPVVGVAELSFSLFKEESGGEPLWFESQTVEVDAQGRYNVLLGAMHADGLPMDLFTSGEARWLSIMVGNAEQPRVLLVSVPYALKAADAESLGGRPATAFVATEQLKEQVATAMSDSTITQRSLNTAALASTGSGTTPAPAFTETNPSTITCNTATNCLVITQSAGAHALLSQMTATSGAFFGVYGTSSSTTGRGVFGHALAATGATYGVRGQANSTSGYGLYGTASAATGVTFGAAGTSASTSGRGIFGDASATTGSTFGLFGQAASISGIGLQGSATAVSGSTIGVRAISFSSAGTAAVIDNLGGGKILSGRTTGFVEKFAVSAAGNVTASGSLTAASGSFTGAVSGFSFSASDAIITNEGFIGDGSGVTNVNAATLNGLTSASFAPVSGSANYVSKAGDTMSGVLQLPADGLTVSGGQLWLADGRVGMGTSSPLAALQIDGPYANDGSGDSALDALTVTGGDGGDMATPLGTAGNGGAITLTGGNGGGGFAVDANGGNGGSIILQPGTGGSGDAFSGAAGNVLLAPNGIGRVGIGTSTPADILQVLGNVRVGTGTNGCVRDFEADIIAGTCSSDLRFKSNVLPYPAVLAKLALLMPVTFDWRAAEFPDQHFGTKRSFGLIAQEVEKVFPEMVIEDAQGFKAVKYHKLPMLMLEGIRELKAENDELKGKNDSLEARVSRNQDEIETLREQLGSVLARLAELESARN